MESFYTIQGEGAFQGHAAYFIRLGGCDVGCVWCDVKESWEASDHPMEEITEIISKVTSSNAPMVVVTGGEPAMYDLTMLTKELKSIGKRTHIETSGAYPVTGTWDWICLSPKKFKKPDHSVYEKANELKVIVYNKSDLKWAIEESAKVDSECRLFLQPEWSVEKKVLPSIIDFVKENPAWRISLQAHKYMNIP